MMMKRKVQEELDKEDKEEKGFGKYLEQAWYKRSPMKILRTNILFQIAELAKERGN